MKTILDKNIAENIKTINSLYSLNGCIAEAISLIHNSLKQGGKVMFCGNGGSAADSQHLAAEFTGRFKKNRKPLSALALSTDSSVLTCISNDYSYDQVFSRQLHALGKEGDCLIVISTSGKSVNVIKAVQMATERKIHTIGFLGGDGGAISKLCEIPIVVPSCVTARIQEAHILIGHTLCEGVEEELFSSGFLDDNEHTTK